MVTVSAFDHPFLRGLLGDEAASRCFTVDAEIEAMLRFESALAEAEARAGVIPRDASAAIADACRRLEPDLARLAAGTARDGVVVPELVKALRAAVGAPHSEHVHRGATSQDVIDTGLALRLKPALGLLARRLDDLILRLDALSASHGAVVIMGRTRMQRALPISFADRIGAWKAPLARHRVRLEDLETRVLTLQLGGAVGTLDQLGDGGPEIARLVGAALGLAVPERCWHCARDGIVELAGWLSSVSGATGKIGKDIVLMAQNEIGEVRISSGGRSSAMPHKANPVKAEILISLARFNATQIGGLHHALIHEMERSGEAWTLEWMILPQMVVATSCALRTCDEVLRDVLVGGGAPLAPEQVRRSGG